MVFIRLATMSKIVLLSHLLLLVSASLPPPKPPTQTFQQKCLTFQPQDHVRNSTLTRLEYVNSGTTLLFPDNDPTCGRARQLVGANLCRVALSIPTSQRSSITYELWLPESWSNSRVLATGNGGIDGCVKYEDLAYGTTNGFATYGTNNGKNGTAGVAFYQNEDIVKDFSWRSLHTSVETSKKLVKEFYAQKIGKSYYLGCSLGGRMGIESSTRFPDDFDGIVAGAPGVDFNNLVSARARYYTITGNTTSPNFIPAALWALINKEILAQCDTIDKVADGIIEDPNKCKFVPERMTCTSGNTTNCLTPAQVIIVKGVFSDFKYPLTNRLIYPAMQPGSEVLSATRLYAGVPFAYSEDWFKYVLYDPTWNAATFSWKDAFYADVRNPADIRTWPHISEFSKYRKAKSKIITYHGLQDNQITSFNTERFFKKLITESSAAKQNNIDDFFRFFRVPGMNHCNGGPGGWVLGQGGNAPAAGIGFEKGSNVLAALVEWVENGNAPQSLIGTKFKGDNVSLGVEYRKRHCLYPSTSTYVGGDATLLESWKCV